MSRSNVEYLKHAHELPELKMKLIKVVEKENI